MNFVFDYDGTLHETALIYVPAVREACRYLSQSGYDRGVVSDERIVSWLGFTAKDMWNSFAPDLPDEVKEHAASLIGSCMRRIVDEGRARLFPGVVEALNALADAGHSLCILSNCDTAYMDMHRAAFGLDRWFSGYYCGEAYDWAPKTDIIACVVKDRGGDGMPFDEFIVAGDRFHDIQAAQAIGARSVGCAYGYGDADELAGATVIVSDSTSLLDGLLAAADGRRP